MYSADEQKDRVKQLINFAINEKKKGLEDLRLQEGEHDLFRVFIDVCLVNMIESFKWKYQAYSTNISQIFSVSDEAFAIVLFESNLNDFQKAMETGEKIVGKSSTNLYTGSNKELGTFQGWHRRGIKRYDEVCMKVHAHRKLEQCQVREVKLRQAYAELSGKAVTTHATDAGNNASDSEESDDGSIDPVDESMGLDFYSFKAVGV